VDECDFDSLLSLKEITPALSHNATEQRFVAVSRHITMF
jgi:hypothetical protein